MNHSVDTGRTSETPGFAPARLVALMRRAVAETRLDLSGLKVLTEAATGAYGVTPVIAALAGAEHVCAFTRESRYGSVNDVMAWTRMLADTAGVADRIQVVDEIPDHLLPKIDIVTNSGHLRPITAALIDRLPPSAVIGLMFEAWEFRAEDIDLAACRRRGVAVIGVNERHPAVDVFSFLGPLCAKQLHDCGFAVRHNRICVICDNDFGPPIASALSSLGARVTLTSNIGGLRSDDWDAVVVALTPKKEPRIGSVESDEIAAHLPPHAVVVQFWGDIDRTALTRHKLRFWPINPPKPGHMAALLSEIGPEPIVRLQTGGLRAAECARRGYDIMDPDGFSQLVGEPRERCHGA